MVDLIPNSYTSIPSLSSSSSPLPVDPSPLLPSESPPLPPVDNSAPASESPPSPPVDNSAPASESPPSPPVDNSAPASESPPSPPVDNSAPASESPPLPPVDNSAPASESPPSPPVDNSAPASESPPSPPVDNSAPASESPPLPPVDNSAPPSESPPSPPVDNSAPASESPPSPPVDNSAPTSESPPSPAVDNSAPPSESPPSPPVDNSTPPPDAPPSQKQSPPPESSSLPPNSGSRNTSPITPSPPFGSSPSSPWKSDPSLSPPPSIQTSLAPQYPPGPRISSDDTKNGTGNGKGITPIAVFGIGIAVTFVVILVAILIWCLKRRRKTKGYSDKYYIPSQTPTTYSQDSGGSSQSTTDNMGNQAYAQSDGGMGNSKSWFTYDDLEHATDGFSYKNVLGEGGFGCVYKGVLHDKREVAVKQLKVGGGQGEREFQAEVEIISRVHHRHLVSLVGYCISDKQRLLVYDYVPNGTLHCHLHGKGIPVMDWATRLKVAAGSARGLAYLHEDCHPRIIHRDIKTSNILLDENFEAKVADFGLAKLTVDTNTHVSTRVMGTFGYMAPEYASSGKLTDRSDVYSFGVVLLEIITGHKPVDSSQPLGEESLVERARPLMVTALESGKFDEFPDPRLENNFSETEMYKMIEVANACVRYNAQMRPRMGRVMRALDNIAESIDLNNGVKPGQTQVFNGVSNVDDMKIFQKMAFGSQDYSSDFSRSSFL